MDYVDDDCMGMFTLGQKTRMHAAANTFRSDLINNSAACVLTSTNNIADNFAVSIFPNPVDNNTIRINILSSSSNDVALRIIDITGKILVEGIINQYGDIDVSALQQGIYFVELIQDNHKNVKKIIIK
jgi:hypothetical protein